MTGSIEIDELTRKLNYETARIPWAELQRFFAQGKTLWVDDSLDLIRVARAVVNDDAVMISQLMEDQLLGQVSDRQAVDWLQGNIAVWTVVSAPWVLVQKNRPEAMTAADVDRS